MTDDERTQHPPLTADDLIWTGGEDEVVEPDEVVEKTPSEAKIKRDFNRRLREIEGRDEKVVNLDDARQRVQYGDGTKESPFREKSADLLRRVLDELGINRAYPVVTHTHYM